VVADPSHHRGKRVVPHQPAPRLLVPSLLDQAEPALHVLPGRAGIVARRHQVAVDRPFAAPGAGPVGEAGTGPQRDRERELLRGRLRHLAPPPARNGRCSGRRSPGPPRSRRSGVARRTGGRSAVGAAGTPPPAPSAPAVWSPPPPPRPRP